MQKGKTASSEPTTLGAGGHFRINDMFRLKMPCANCPFRKEGAIHLSPGRLSSIIDTLLKDDHTTFYCHKIVHSIAGGLFEDGLYTPSTKDAMCAGAAAYLMKAGRPTIGMRIAYLTGAVAPSEWDKAADVVIDPPFDRNRK
ncbi:MULTISPECIES: hypothetical protein [Klebsiella/Raoultella group]|uniref:hypothetical protein n=1 Tax=Klebsiella/Raoultella group TaxID=2890311 RepID=UPI000E340770|nr:MULTISPECIES: hypothetical protein [Klebsiella/Raoultella group]EIC1057237.1 hypothetical protein [Escherichia coli]HBT4841726.1 hypothetical protein [Klebsiella variicola subsp. variicola]HED3066929.1 hypothetical protein [Kluyvera ascorbata]EIX9200753.1 hypothetical protein [Klebsiella pneumoniae]MDE8912985.1 hypothetical protein [Klebsiella pneumoniae]